MSLVTLGVLVLSCHIHYRGRGDTLEEYVSDDQHNSKFAINKAVSDIIMGDHDFRDEQ